MQSFILKFKSEKTAINFIEKLSDAFINRNFDYAGPYKKGTSWETEVLVYDKLPLPKFGKGPVMVKSETTFAISD